MKTHMLLLLVVLGMTGGCVHEQRLERRVNAHLASIDYTIGRAAAAEGVKPDRLARAGEYIDRKLRRAADRTAENGVEIEQLWRRSVQRWEDNQPRYLERAQRYFGGKPDNLEITAIDLFF